MFSRPVRIGLNPAPSAMSAPIRPRISIRPLSGLIRPLSIFRRVVFPAPLRPIKPRHSPRLSSKETSFTAQNSSGRRPEEFCSEEIGVRRLELVTSGEETEFGSWELGNEASPPSSIFDLLPSSLPPPFPFFANGFKSQVISCT